MKPYLELVHAGLDERLVRGTTGVLPAQCLLCLLHPAVQRGQLLLKQLIVLHSRLRADGMGETEGEVGKEEAQVNRDNLFHMHGFTHAQSWR